MDHELDDLAVFPTDKDIAEAVVSDGPNEGDDFVVGGVVHWGYLKLSAIIFTYYWRFRRWQQED